MKPKIILSTATLLIAVTFSFAQVDTIIMAASQSYTTCKGVFYDAGGASSNYPSNQNIIITLFPNDTINKKLSVTFSSIAISDGDYLQVYDGNSTAAPIKAFLSNATLDSGAIISTASNGSLTFKFYSDFNFVNTGWEASIDCVAPYSVPPSGNITMLSSGIYYNSCGANFYDIGGPNGSYIGNQNFRVVTLYPNDTINKKLSVTFSSIAISDGDYLQVYDGNSTAAPIKAFLSNATLDSGAIISTASNGSLTFKFYSDFNFVNTGWEASIDCVAPYSVPPSGNITMLSSGIYYNSCGANFYDIGGPNGSYIDNQNFRVVTLYPNDTINKKLSVTFSSIAISDGDYLQVYDGNSTAAPIKAFLSNATLDSGAIISTASNGSLTFKFYSDFNFVNTGWEASIDCVAPYSVPPSGNITMLSSGIYYNSCGANFYDNGGPNGSYIDNQNFRVVTLYPNDTINKKLSVTFSSIAISDGDYLQVYDGNSTAAPIKAFLSNATLDSGAIISTASNGSLTFKFYSDFNFVNTGWEASIDCVAPYSVPPSGNITMLSSGIYQVCNARFYDIGGPNGNYIDDQNFRVVTFFPQDTTNQKIKVIFSSFSTEVGDYLRVYNGNNTSAPEIAYLSGVLDTTIISMASNGSLTFKFYSDFNFVNTGWEAEVISIGPPPNGYAVTNPPLICPNDVATLNLSGNYISSIQWQKSNNGVSFSDVLAATSETYITPPLTATVYYRAMVSNCEGEIAYSDTVELFIDTGLTISGVVRTEDNNLIPNVSMNMSGDTVQTVYTDTVGYYNFHLAQCGDYVVKPFKNNDSIPPCGITTQDILLIRRQILAIQNLASPYQIIAADVNGSGSVTTTDILLIRSVILQYKHTFPPNQRVWAFVPESYQFPNQSNPFPFPDSLTYYNVLIQYSNQNFIGIRLGDVNNNCTPTFKTGPVGEVLFSMNEYTATPGDEIIVPVKVKNFKNVTGYQFTLSWNPEVLSLFEVSNKSVNGYYGNQKISEGFLTTSWNDEMAKGVSLNDNETVFELKFKVIGENGSSSEIKINSAMTASEAYNENLDLLSVQSSNGLVKVNDYEAITNHQSSIINLQVQPNPFTNSTNITFSIPEDEVVTINIFDALGKVVRSVNSAYKAGENRLIWAADDASGMALNRGLYLIRLTAGQYVSDSKAVLIR